MICVECGHTADDGDALFCTECGEPLDIEGDGSFIPEPRLVPGAGILAWDRPDATTAPTCTLAPGTSVIVVERRDTWARVRAESGIAGWVERRRLVDPDLPTASIPQPHEPPP